MRNLYADKRLQKDFSEKWQVKSPVSNTWITIDEQNDEINEARNKVIINNYKVKRNLR